MAEINTQHSSSHKKIGVKKLQKHSIRIDLTPMVDLGFLLITFFVYTTSLAQPKAMKLVLPDNSDPSTGMPVPESGSLTIIIDSNNSIFYYEGFLANNGSNVKECTTKEIRNIIINKKRFTPEPGLFIILKATPSSLYRELVNLLDEMIINDIHRYSLDEMKPLEEEILKKRIRSRI